MSSAAVNARLRGSDGAAAEESFALLEELSCPVCLGLFADPVVLPCGHVFCKECTRVLGVTSSSAYVTCPNCREKHHLSEVSRLQPCHNLKRIIKNLDKLIRLDDELLADLAAMNLEEKLDSVGDAETPASAAEAARAARRENLLSGGDAAAGGGAAAPAGKGPLGLPLRVLSAPQQQSLLQHWATAQRQAGVLARQAQRGASAAAETVVHLSRQAQQRIQQQRQQQGGGAGAAE